MIGIGSGRGRGGKGSQIHNLNPKRYNLIDIGSGKGWELYRSADGTHLSDVRFNIRVKTLSLIIGYTLREREKGKGGRVVFSKVTLCCGSASVWGERGKWALSLAWGWELLE